MPTILDGLQSSLRLLQNLFGRWKHQFRVGSHGCRRKDQGWIRISVTSGPVTVQATLHLHQRGIQIRSKCGPVTVQMELHLHRTSSQDVVDEKVVIMKYLLVLIVVMH